ncbi:hypothetical protein BCR32DRAFT_296910 [Anaeromyces robustus]|uniref:AAA-ATPase-like domain-containing protein n=1 Tax=Anaeromyces robustus TaxID=1754192 RepID=A0A1Y1WQ96_9FUNG|nr:hypothetical protein BCR32DRAFT_296910 [Anaeromyces robustus]|eukprot:ORX75436.1 hypothetical protein BCR32DRAFT_296910 [Anaeromyces robustus]
MEIVEIFKDIENNTGRKIVLIIDEYDYVLRKSNIYNNIKQDDYLYFLQFLNVLIKDNSYLALVYMTEQNDTYRNNNELLNDRENEMNFNNIKNRYDGYKLTDGENNYNVYTPWSIIKAIELKVLKIIWNNSSTTESITPYIEMNFYGLKEDILRLVKENKKIKINKVARLIEEYHDNVDSMEYNNENSFKYTIKDAFYVADQYYNCYEEYSSAYVPINSNSNYPALIIELKYGKSPETAIKQIKKMKILSKIKSL